MHFSIHWLKLTLLFCGMSWWHTYLAVWLGMVCTCDGMLDVQRRKYVCIKLYIIQTHGYFQYLLVSEMTNDRLKQRELWWCHMSCVKGVKGEGNKDTYLVNKCTAPVSDDFPDHTKCVELWHKCLSHLSAGATLQRLSDNTLSEEVCHREDVLMVFHGFFFSGPMPPPTALSPVEICNITTSPNLLLQVVHQGKLYLNRVKGRRHSLYGVVLLASVTPDGYIYYLDQIIIWSQTKPLNQFIAWEP